MNHYVKLGFTVFGIIALIVGLGLLFSLPIMLLWNHVLVNSIDGVRPIGLLEAWAILICFNIVTKILFGAKGR